MKKLTIFIALTLMTLLVACNPKKNGVRSNVGGRTGVNGGAGVMATSTQCMNTNMNMGGMNSSTNTGYIYDSNNSFNFENQVKALLSATMSPYDIGSISSSGPQLDGSGVGFTGSVQLDQNGNVNTAQSSVVITVYDSVWVANQIASNLIPISFGPNTGTNATVTGQFNFSTGEAVLNLKDQYGEIRFNGRVDAQNFSGTVTFQNATSVLGGGNAGGTLGQFMIQRCALLH